MRCLPLVAITYFTYAYGREFRGRLHIGGIRVLVYASWGVLAACAQLAPSRSRADSTRGRGDVRQDREWGMVRHLSLPLSPARSVILLTDWICTQDKWLGPEIHARVAYTCPNQVGSLSSL